MQHTVNPEPVDAQSLDRYVTLLDWVVIVLIQYDSHVGFLADDFAYGSILGVASIIFVHLLDYSEKLSLVWNFTAIETFALVVWIFQFHMLEHHGVEFD